MLEGAVDSVEKTAVRQFESSRQHTLLRSHKLLEPQQTCDVRRLAGDDHVWIQQLGQPVRVNKEALAGIEGFVVQKNKGVCIVLILDFLMQSIAIEVDGQDIELIDTSFPQALKAQTVKEQQRLALCDFHCLDSYSDSSRFSVSAGF